MMIKKTRLNAPGFSKGVHSDVGLDIAKLYGGRPFPKRSGNPHGITELLTGSVISRARKGLQLATRIAKEDYSRKKRIADRAKKKAIPAQPVKACNRRFFEHLGMQAGFLAYCEQPELVISKAKQAYELTDGFLPFVTTTSSREALLIIASLAKYGIAAYFNVVRPITS